MRGCVYILASAPNRTLYTGVTRDLAGRLYEYQNELTPRQWKLNLIERENPGWEDISFHLLGL
ncbi:GIY-YIG nuclease family protein [Rhizobium bangladeshense]|uniref:GIY-YIG nuclease family protein n=1 Tax=Rhizobium bangladeshense TaxID=1138189 RepID=UPI0007E5A2A9|nr:GIY-YIG nuclease family protein [Rhizobium bangladeshense]